MPPRVALLIGNGAYRHLPRLRTSAADARLMAGALSAHGFELIGGAPLIEADHAAMTKAIVAFRQRLESGGTGLFYFSGHGAHRSGANRLFPVDATLDDAPDMPVDAGDLLAALEASGPGRLLFVLDAAHVVDPARACTGLAAMAGRPGTLVALAAQPGEAVAEDREAHGAYALALSQTLGTVDGTLASFIAAGRLVRQRTGGRQAPWLHALPAAFRGPLGALDDTGRDEADDTAKPPPTELLPDLSATPEDLGSRVAGAAGEIVLAAGHFCGLGEIAQPLSLQGAGAGRTVVAGPLRIHGGRVALRNLTIAATGPEPAVIVTGGTVELTDCTLARQTALDGSGIGLEVRTAEATCDGLTVAGFPVAIRAGSGARVAIRARCRLTAPASRPDGARSAGLLAEDGGHITAQEVSARGFAKAACAHGPAAGDRPGEEDGADHTQLDLDGLDAEMCATGLVVRGAHARATLRQGRVSGCGTGVSVSDGAMAHLASSDIIFEKTGLCVRGARLQADGGSLVATQRRGGTGALVEADGAAHLSGVRVSGGASGFHAAAGTLSATECLVEDSFHAGAECAAGGTLTLSNCEIRRCRGHGIGLDGTGQLINSQIHHNGRAGIEARSGADLALSSSWLHHNGSHGLALIGTARARLELCTLLVNRGSGIVAGDATALDAAHCAIRQNGAGITLSGAAQALVTRCDLRGNAARPPIAYAPGTILTASGNATQPAAVNPPGEGSGTMANILFREDTFFAPLAHMLDLVREEAGGPVLREWRTEPPVMDPDGRRVIFGFARERMLEAPSRNAFGRMGRARPLRYALFMTVTITAEPGVEGLDRLIVAVREAETISGPGAARASDLPSLIHREQVGAGVLDRIAARLMPT